MGRNTIALAKWGMQRELAALWEECFGEPSRQVKFFFNNAFQPQNCLVYLAEGKLAAMVHLLPSGVLWNGGFVQAHYIYAAATKPEYRSNGYMRALLNCAAYIGRRRGDEFSLLLPANRSLYRYYAAAGYFHLFELRNLELNKEQVADFSEGRPFCPVLPDYRKMKLLRNKLLSDLSGSVLWDARAVAYADSINRLYGGKLICTRNGQHFAYALCRELEGGICEVEELMSRPEDLPFLLGNLLKGFPAENYRFRLPNDHKLFPSMGEASQFGMIKPLGKRKAEDLLDGAYKPYLGLTLD